MSIFSSYPIFQDGDVLKSELYTDKAQVYTRNHQPMEAKSLKERWFGTPKRTIVSHVSVALGLGSALGLGLGGPRDTESTMASQNTRLPCQCIR